MRFYELCFWTPFWHAARYEADTRLGAFWLTADAWLGLDHIMAGTVGVSGLAYTHWLYELWVQQDQARMAHLLFTFVANGTMIFRLLIISGAVMSTRAVHGHLRQAVMRAMHKWGERVLEVNTAQPAPS